ncbi:DUF2283 domain-containing protein [Rhodococcus sp. GOMB7]|uniref:DUF2283 domain-containing protein n=1 Tax=Rhodococcus sp. GOMB7 TaxID=2839033 RepID=UPI001C002151|nr:DUF2283 domain-containing protein [Rhodococcus sp. GOMB7]MBT9293649.1 DUF2283 domain-containing protein [Rhodococcus sp. GOMB7]
MEKKIVLTVDAELRVAYIKLQSTRVARTVELTDEILVDLDEFGVVRGIEVLDLAAELPMLRLAEEMHVHSDVIALLRRIRPSISGFVSQVSSNPGRSSLGCLTTA